MFNVQYLHNNANVQSQLSISVRRTSGNVFVPVSSGGSSIVLNIALVVESGQANF